MLKSNQVSGSIMGFSQVEGSKFDVRIIVFAQIAVSA